MKIAYVTKNNVLNKQDWSQYEQGLWSASYYISKYLIDDSDYINYISTAGHKFRALTRAKWSYYRRVFKKDYYSWAEPLVLKDYANQIKKQLLKKDFDIVLCPENVVPIAYLECKKPIVLWTDSTLSSLINFYPHMGNLCQENIKNIYAMEAAALHRCQMLIYTSDWAAQTAIDTYGISPSKIKVLPWCAHLQSNRNLADIHNIMTSKPSSPCKLLFIGVDWVRKGGNTALQVAQKLNNLGLKTELTVVGCQPQISHIPKFVKVINFIDKSKQEGLEEINKLFAEAHFFILPSIADCTPIVLAEANSFGIPCLTTNVGGMATLIKDGLNGKIFSLEASALDYCSYISSLMTHYSEYKKLAFSSFEEYQAKLNWNVTVERAKHFMSELIG
jgi:glycosyltransferase involved in cell wall biosynthesis